jgi:hypothetical protein
MTTPAAPPGLAARLDIPPLPDEIVDKVVSFCFCRCKVCGNDVHFSDMRRCDVCHCAHCETCATAWNSAYSALVVPTLVAPANFVRFRSGRHMDVALPLGVLYF